MHAERQFGALVWRATALRGTGVAVPGGDIAVYVRCQGLKPPTQGHNGSGDQGPRQRRVRRHLSRIRRASRVTEPVGANATIGPWTRGTASDVLVRGSAGILWGGLSALPS